MNHKNFIRLQDLNFSFSVDSKPFFKNMTIDFKVGQINFICGKNGMGKSTLLKILSGCAPQQNLNGILQIGDMDYNIQNLDSICKSIAMVSQNFNSMLVDSYSFYENLQFALLPQYPSLSSLPLALPLPTFVEKYGINYHMPIDRLSGGQRQILSILMVLQRCPQILLLDEPTTALDEENATIVMDFLQDLCIQENITIIAIVHHFELMQKYAGSSYFELYQEHKVRNVRVVSM
ncbi:MAG: ATP-binding cassette domain-containing protein [Candidatus Dependentiae bacterium]|nr:ATP-binding cassette domain-containing protein [Candidatus Dependentiae bacterium]